MDKKINRREFVKLSLGATTGLSLSPLLKGCATISTIKETPEEVDAILESHPGIPTPKNGKVYSGLYENIIVLQHAPTIKEEHEIKALEDFQEQMGVLPAVHCFHHASIGDEYFPSPIVKAAHSMGVHTHMRYYPWTNWEKISKGALDEELDGFIEGALKTNIPFFFVPFPESDLTKGRHPWKKWDPNYFKPAWNRMFNKFEDAGANKLAVWGLHLQSGHYRDSNRPIKLFWVPPEQVHWVGTSSYGKDRYVRKSFKNLVSLDYGRMTNHYPTKPFANWEMGWIHREWPSGYKKGGSWLKDAFQSVPNFPRLKMITPWHIDEPFSDKRNSIPWHPLTKPGYAEGLKSPYILHGGQNL